MTGARKSPIALTEAYAQDRPVHLDVDREWHVREGIGLYDFRLPKSVQAYKVITQFFVRNLGSK